MMHVFLIRDHQGKVCYSVCNEDEAQTVTEPANGKYINKCFYFAPRSFELRLDLS